MFFARPKQHQLLPEISETSQDPDYFPELKFEIPYRERNIPMRIVNEGASNYDCQSYVPRKDQNIKSGSSFRFPKYGNRLGLISFRSDKFQFLLLIQVSCFDSEDEEVLSIEVCLLSSPSNRFEGEIDRVLVEKRNCCTPT